MPTRCAGVIALTLLRRRILSSISNAYLRRITTLSSGGKTSRSRWRIYSRTDWHPATGAPQPEQQQLLQQLLTMPPGVAAVTAARGRGKSALAGQLISRIAGSAIVTAPAKAATDVLAQFAGEKFRFIAPDALLASDEQADWLVVDEAAAIPAPLLHQLVSRFPRTLLTTTVQGYEGTGRGFLLKFCARFPHLHRFELQQPIRWAQGCPLEKMVSEALVLTMKTSPIHHKAISSFPHLNKRYGEASQKRR